jgi:hypothetical protein
MEGFRVEMEQELQTLRFELEDEGKAMLGIVDRIIILPYFFVHSSTVNVN